MHLPAFNIGGEAGKREEAWQFWVLQTGGWLLIFPAILAAEFYFLNSFRFALVLAVIRVALGFLITVALQRAYHRLPLRTMSPLRLGVHALLLCGLGSLCEFAVGFPFSALLGLPAPVMHGAAYLIAKFPFWMVLFAAWSFCYFGITQWRLRQESDLRASRSESAVRQVEISMLRSQLDAHFLFNALNSIAAYASEDPAMVEMLVHAMAQYLRFSLTRREGNAPLGEEIDAIENYLRIEKARFEETLQYTVTATPEARLVPAPLPMIQPLVENAIKYGRKTSPGLVRLAVTAEVKDGLLRIEVANSGRWVDTPPPGATQIGLVNLRRKLALLYGDRAALATFCEAGQVRVTLTLPSDESPHAHPLG